MNLFSLLVKSSDSKTKITVLSVYVFHKTSEQFAKWLWCVHCVLLRARATLSTSEIRQDGNRRSDVVENVTGEYIDGRGDEGNSIVGQMKALATETKALATETKKRMGRMERKLDDLIAHRDESPKRKNITTL